MKTFILLIFSIFVFTACSNKNIEIADIKNYSQNPAAYTKNITLPELNQDKDSKNFIKKYFSPWSLEKLTHTREEASWGNYYAKKKVYLDNHRLATKEWFDKLIDNSNFEEYNTVLKKAITIKNSNVRVFPTYSRFFYNPSKAGEGYPFDYNQNSLLKINTPLLISHYSKDKAWAFIQSYIVSGWIRADKLKVVDEDFINSFKTGQYGVFVKEFKPIFDDTFIEYIKVGTIFPKEKDKFLVATNTEIKKIHIKKENIANFPLKFDKLNLQNIAKEFMGEMYGWGGVGELRDCSSFTQDFFIPFGVFLERNSKGQTYHYKYIDLSKMNDIKKKNYIKKHAVPFLTLVYMPGHIMLYIGTKEKEPIIMHNFWGIKTWQFPFTLSRNIVGQTSITTLEPGKELNNADKNKTILRRVKGIVILN